MLPLIRIDLNSTHALHVEKIGGILQGEIMEIAFTDLGEF